MTREEIIDLCGTAARDAQIRDDVCSRSTLVGLKAAFDWIPDDMIRSSMNLCGGAGGSSGTCGTFTAGLLAVGLKYNVPLEEEMKNPALQEIRAQLYLHGSRRLRGILADRRPQREMRHHRGEGCALHRRLPAGQ